MGNKFWQEQDIFTVVQKIQIDCGVDPASYSMGTSRHFPVVKRPGHEGEHSTPSSANVNNKWCYISTPPTCLCGMYRDNCTFTIYCSRIWRSLSFGIWCHVCCSLIWWVYAATRLYGVTSQVQQSSWLMLCWPQISRIRSCLSRCVWHSDSKIKVFQSTQQMY